jgi:agmatinase
VSDSTLNDGWRRRRAVVGPQREPGPISLVRYEEETAYQGFQTFLKLPICLTPDDLRAGEVDVAIAGVPFEMVDTRGGTAHGPRGLRNCEYLPTPPLERPHVGVGVDPLQELTMVDYGDSPVSPFDLEKSIGAIESFVAEILGTGAVPILIGGDHTITLPIVRAFSNHYGAGKVGIVHFDAHSDTAAEMAGTVFSHGSAFRRLIEEGHVLGQNLIQVGLRGYWPGDEHLAWMREHEIKTHFMAEVEVDGARTVMERVIEEAGQGAEHLFVSVDVDVFDPAFAPGTGSPEPGGLAPLDVLPTVRRLAHEVGICGMDVVEVSPPYDTENGITALLAHRVIMEGLTGMALRRRGIEGRDYHDPRFLHG